MGKLMALEEARAKKREKREHAALVKLAHAQFTIDDMAIANRSAKTIHHQVDLRLMIIRVHKLQLEHGFVRQRLRYAIDENKHALVLVDMPSGWYVVGDGDVQKMSSWPSKIVEWSPGLQIGVWERVDG